MTKTAHKVLAALFLTAWTALTVLSLQLSTPCPQEDSTLCYWDGDARGNKTGKSFISLTEQLKIETK